MREVMIVSSVASIVFILGYAMLFAFKIMQANRVRRRLLKSIVISRIEH